MPSEHARLGPSAAERWMACPASIRLEAEVPPEADTRYSREGTLAHGLAEIEAAVALGLRTPEEGAALAGEWLAVADKELTDEQVADIRVHAVAYADLLVEKRDEVPGTVVFLEQRVLPGVSQCWGTGDAILVRPDGSVEIVDFKYGAGVHVDVVDNPQLKLYGLGALEGYGDVLGEADTVRTTIYQPRMHAQPSSHDYTPEELRTWRDEEVIPAAELALSDDAPFHPGEVQCRWCPAAGICRPRMEAATAEDFSTDPDILSDAELGEILGRLPAILDWAAAVRATVFRKIWDDGHPVPGWKVVLTAGKRSITDHQQAISLLADAGYQTEDVSRRTTKTLGDLEKLVGKAKLPEILGDLLKKGEGSKALAPEDDPRPSADPHTQAVADFTDEESVL